MQSVELAVLSQPAETTREFWVPIMFIFEKCHCEPRTLWSVSKFSLTSSYNALVL